MPATSRHGSGSAAAPSRIGAFFDVDNTLIPGPAIEVRFFRHLYRQGVVGLGDILKSAGYLLQHLPTISLHPLRERKLYLEGKRPEAIEPLADAFIQREIRPLVSRAAMARLEEHQRNGHLVVFITGCPEFLIRPLAKSLGVETIFCAQPDLDEAGAYTGHLTLPLPYGEGKRVLVEEFAHEQGLNLKECHAYGDSPGDAEILLAVGHPLVVNPIRGMESIAQKCHWPIVKWE
jgi:HAD superfamily hydrolase (TIGR01490 family)